MKTVINYTFKKHNELSPLRTNKITNVGIHGRHDKIRGGKEMECKIQGRTRTGKNQEMKIKLKKYK